MQPLTDQIALLNTRLDQVIANLRAPITPFYLLDEERADIDQALADIETNPVEYELL